MCSGHALSGLRFVSARKAAMSNVGMGNSPGTCDVVSHVIRKRGICRLRTGYRRRTIGFGFIFGHDCDLGLDQTWFGGRCYDRFNDQKSVHFEGSQSSTTKTVSSEINR